MSKEKSLENVKRLREITGVGFKDCKLALDENNKNDFINLLMNLCNEEKVTLVMASHDKSLKKNFDISINLEKILL